MAAALLPDTAVSATWRWSLAAGLYMYVCGTVIALALNDVFVLFGEWWDSHRRSRCSSSPSPH